jgi:hypothetical protein
MGCSSFPSFSHLSSEAFRNVAIHYRMAHDFVAPPKVYVINPIFGGSGKPITHQLAQRLVGRLGNTRERVPLYQLVDRIVAYYVQHHPSMLQRRREAVGLLAAEYGADASGTG